MARYGQKFKDVVVARLLPPEGSSLEAVSQKVGISVATLGRWRAAALAGRDGNPSPPPWTPTARPEAVIATAALRVRMGDGVTCAKNRHLPREEVWLLGEWHASDERKYYFSNLSPRTARRAGESGQGTLGLRAADQQLKQELGPGHFEGRSWTGLHRRALMSCIAFACLQHHRLVVHHSTVPEKSAPAFRGRHHHLACRRCAVPSSGSCSRQSWRPSDVHTAVSSLPRRLIRKCPGSARLPLVMEVTRDLRTQFGFLLRFGDFRAGDARDHAAGNSRI